MEIVNSLLLDGSSVGTIDTPVSRDVEVLFRSNVVVFPLSVMTNISVINVVGTGTEGLLEVLSGSFRSNTTVADADTRGGNGVVFTLDLGVFASELLSFSRGFDGFKNSLSLVPLIFINGGDVSIDNSGVSVVTSVNLVVTHGGFALESFTFFGLVVISQEDGVFNVFFEGSRFSLVLVEGRFAGGSLFIDFTSLFTSQGHSVTGRGLPLVSFTIRTGNQTVVLNTSGGVSESESTIFRSSSVQFSKIPVEFLFARSSVIEESESARFGSAISVPNLPFVFKGSIVLVDQAKILGSRRSSGQLCKFVD